MLSRDRRPRARALVGTTALLFGLVLLPVAARATTYTVNNNGDAGDASPGNNVCATAGGVCTLRAAIQEANAHSGPDTIVIPAMTITLGSELLVTQDVTISGAGPGTIISGNNVTRVFDFGVSSGTHSLSNLTIQYANTTLDGGGLWNGGNLTVTSVTFANNVANQGGAAYCDTAAAPGQPYQPSLTMSAVTFTGNSNTSPTFGQGGGALFNGCTLIVSNASFSTNVSNLEGGAFYNNSPIGATVQISDFVMDSNSAKWGGAVENDLGTVTLLRGTISNNTSTCCDPFNAPPNNSTGGGGVSQNEGSMSLTDVTLVNNQATSPGGYGGAVYSSEVMTLTRVSMSGNQAAYGAGIYNGNFLGVTNSMTLTNVTISGNIGRNSASPLVNSTGAGIFNTTQGQMTLTNSTVANNSAVLAGGIYNNPGGTANAVTLRNTILSGNTGSAGSPNCGGTVTSGGSNIVQSATGCTFITT